MPQTVESKVYTIYISNYWDGTSEIATEALMQTIPMEEGDIEDAIIDAVVKAEIGKAGSFEFSIPINHPYYNALRPMRTLIRVEFYGNEIFRGRVLTIGKEMYGTRAVHCEGAFAFFLDSHQEGSKEETRSEITVLQYLEQLINNHNADVKENWKRVMLGNVPGNYDSNVDDKQKVVIPKDKEKQKFGSTSWDTTMDRLEDLLNQFGGYFRLRPVWDGEYYSGDLSQVGTLYVPDGTSGTIMAVPTNHIVTRGSTTDADVIERNRETKETFGAVLDWFENYYTLIPNGHNGDPIAAGKNLMDLKGETAVDNLFTVVIPIGKKDSEDVFITDYWPTASEGHAKVNYIEVPELVKKNLYTYAELSAHPFRKSSDYNNAIARYGRIYKKVEFENANTPEKLFNYAKQWIKENYMPDLTQWDVTALDLRVISINHPVILVGDLIDLVHPEVTSPFNGFTVISAEYDLFNPEKNKYKIGIPNQNINASYGVKNKKSSGGGSSTPSSATPPDSGTEEIKEEIARLKAQLQQRYSLKTDWNQNITYDDPLAFAVFGTDGTQLSEIEAAKKMAPIVTQLMRTKTEKAGELTAQALQRGCAKDDVQLLIDNTPAVKTMQRQWKTGTQSYMVGTLGMTSQEAEVLTNESAGSSWLAALVDDDGNWSELAISKGYAAAGNSKLKKQAIATRKILNGSDTPPGANVIQNAGSQLVGDNLFLSNFFGTDSETESVGIGDNGNGGWNINLNLPFTYTYDGHDYNVPSGAISAQDFNLREVPSFAAKFAMIDDLIANCVTANELNAAIARIGTVEANYVTAESMKSMNIYAKDFILYGYHAGNISLANAIKAVTVRDNGDGTNTLMYMTMLDTQMVNGPTFSSATPLSAAWSSETTGGAENVYTVGSRNQQNDGWIGKPKQITIKHLMGHVENETFVAGNSDTTGTFWHKVGNNYFGAVQVFANDGHVIELIPILGMIPYQGGQQSVTVGSITWAENDAKTATIHLNGNSNTKDFKIDHLQGHMENGVFTTANSDTTNSVWNKSDNGVYSMVVQVYCPTDAHVIENVGILGTIPYQGGYEQGLIDAGISAESVTIKPLEWSGKNATITLNGSSNTRTFTIDHLLGHVENGAFTTSNSSTTNSVWHRSGDNFSMAVQVYCPTDGHVIENIGILGTIPFDAGKNSVTVSSLTWNSSTGTIALSNGTSSTFSLMLKSGHMEGSDFVEGTSPTTGTIWRRLGNTYSTAIQVFDSTHNTAVVSKVISGVVPYNAGKDSVTFSSVTWDAGKATITLSNNRTRELNVTLNTGHAESGSFVQGTSDTTGSIWYQNGESFSTAVQAYDSTDGAEIGYAIVLGVVPYNAGKNAVTYQSLAWNNGTGTVTLSNGKTGSFNVTLRTGHAESGSFVSGTSSTTGTIWYRNGNTFSTAVQAYDSTNSAEIRYTTILGVVPFREGWKSGYNSVSVSGESATLNYGESTTITVTGRAQATDTSDTTIRTITITAPANNHNTGGATADVVRAKNPTIPSGTTPTMLDYGAKYSFTPRYTNAAGALVSLTDKAQYVQVPADRYETGWSGCYNTVSLSETTQTLAYGSSVTISALAKASSTATDKEKVVTITITAPANNHNTGGATAGVSRTNNPTVPSGTTPTMLLYGTTYAFTPHYTNAAGTVVPLPSKAQYVQVPADRYNDGWKAAGAASSPPSTSGTLTNHATFKWPQSSAVGTNSRDYYVTIDSPESSGSGSSLKYTVEAFIRQNGTGGSKVAKTSLDITSVYNAGLTAGGGGHTTANSKCVNNVEFKTGVNSNGQSNGTSTATTLYYKYNGSYYSLGTGFWYLRGSYKAPTTMYT